MSWRLYGNFKAINSIADMPKGAIGFVYLITNKEKYEMYIGKKSLYSTIKRKFGKKESASVTDKRKKLYEMVTKESNWKTYQSSNKEVQGWKEPSKQILEFAYSKKELSYLEEKYLFKNDVLEDKTYKNDNIGGKYFKDEFKNITHYKH